MNTKRITMNDGSLHVTIEGPSTNFDARDLIIPAIVALIQETDTSWWEKREAEQGIIDSVRPADRFYSSVLSAVARHYAVDAMLPEDMETHAVLFQLIGEITNQGRLRNVIRAGTAGEADRADEDD